MLKVILLWGREVYQGTVLYLALEDTKERLQLRLYRMFGVESTSYLKMSIVCKPLGKGLEQQLQAFIEDYPDVGLIIIDTLQRIRDDGGDAYNYGKDYEIIQKIKAISDDRNICILMVHHTRKKQASDKFDMISGTNGLFGAADGAMMLTVDERTKAEARIDVAGRDQQDQRIYLKREQQRLTWEFDRADTTIRKEPPDQVLIAISQFITPDNPRWEGTVTELLTLLDLDVQPNALGMMLNIRTGRLYEDYQIRYETKRTHSGRKIFLTLETVKT